MADVVEQLVRIQRVMDLLVPGSIRVAAPVVPGGTAALLAAPSAAEASGSPAADGSAPRGGGFRDEPAAPSPAAPSLAAPSPAASSPAASSPVSPAAPQVRFVQPVVDEGPDDFVTEALAEALAAQRSSASVGVPIPRRAADDAPVAPVPSAAAPAMPLVSVPVAPPVSAPVAVNGSSASGPAAPPASAPVAVNGSAVSGPVADAVPVSPASPPGPAIPAWAAIGTGARPAVSIVGSPWWRLAVDRLSKQVAQELSVEDLPDMTYPRITELARNLAARNTELGEGVVRAFVNDYIRELNGEYGEVAYPWRDFLPAPVTAAPGSPAWQTALEELRTALEEELSQGVPADPYELSDLLIPTAPRLDEETVRTFIGDYLLALNGQAGSGSDQPWQHLLPRPQSARSATDEEILGAYGGQLEEYLAANGRITRNRVQSITGIKSRVQADRLKATIEERAAETASA